MCKFETDDDNIFEKAAASAVSTPLNRPRGWNQEYVDYHLQDWSTEARQKRADYMARQHPRAPRDMDYRLHFAERFAYLPEYRKLQRKARRIVAAARLEMEKLDARRQAVSRNPGESARQKQSVFEHLTKQQKRVAIEACEQAEAAHERRPPNPNPGIRNGSKQR